MVLGLRRACKEERQTSGSASVSVSYSEPESSTSISTLIVGGGPIGAIGAGFVTGRGGAAAARGVADTLDSLAFLFRRRV